MRAATRSLVPALRLLPDLAADKDAPFEPLALQLVGLGHALLDAAKARSIPAPALAPDPPTIMSAFAALHGAGMALSGRTPMCTARLWTGLAPLRSGAIRQNLMNDRARGSRRQNILVLVGDGFDGPLIYCAGQSPIRVEHPVAGNPAAQGPYLVFALCELTARNQVTLVAAGAIAVLAANRLMPVSGDLERDAMRALLHLQETLDASGVECTVERRAMTGEGQHAQVSLALGRSGATDRTLGFAIAGRSDCTLPCVPGEDELALNVASWRDGSFMAKLAKQIDAVWATWWFPAG